MSIIVSDLHCTYNRGLPTEHAALCGVSFTAEKGSVVSIVGHTGSGKSTLAQHLNGLLIPQSGDVTVDEIKISDDTATLRKIRRMVGFVFQYPEQQIFADNVRDEVAFGPLNWGVPADDAYERVVESLTSVGFDMSMLDANPLTLSGGQKRRVAIASILASRPSYLVLDEPSAGLDATGIDELIGILMRQKAAGDGIIHITHDIDLALEISDSILILESGTVKFFGTPQEVEEKICSTQSSGVEVPSVLKLSWKLRELGKISKITNAPLELASMIGGGE